MHYVEPTHSTGSTFAGARHDTLNFENCASEPSYVAAAEAAPLATVLPFPTATRSWITVNIHRKDFTMTDTHHDSDVEQERVATYSPSGHLHADIATQTGDVIVRATDQDHVTVTLHANSPRCAYLLEAADVLFDASRNTLNIRTLPKGLSVSARGLRIGPSRSWFDFGSSDLDVLIEVPRGTSLDVSTVTGDSSLFGSLGVVSVKSVSGDVTARDTSDTLDVQTASGDINSGHVVTSLKCTSASGDVTCHGAAANTEIHSASGDVLLSADQPGKIVVRNVTGDVIVRVARGLAVDISGNTLSGSMGTNIDLDGEGDGATDEDTITIKVSTVSGDIRIDKAS